MDFRIMKTEKAPSVNIKPKKPILLSSKKFKQLQENATDTGAGYIRKQKEKDRLAIEASKIAGEEIMMHFSGTTTRNEEQQVEARKKKVQEKAKEDRLVILASVKKTQDKAENIHRKKIDAAYRLLENVKQGPRSLTTAALQSELQDARNMQIKINKAFEKVKNHQECEYKKDCVMQNVPWVREEQDRITERQIMETSYKRNLLKTITAKREEQTEAKKKELEVERELRKQTNLKLKEEEEKARQEAERKKASVRQHVAEAKLMTEESRKRERLFDTVEDRLCCVYNVGKRELAKINTERLNKHMRQCRKMQDFNAKKLKEIEEKMCAAENSRIQRDIDIMNAKFNDIEQKKRAKMEQLKQELIGAHALALEQEEEKKRFDMEQKRFDMATRLKNDEVNCLFSEAAKQNQLRKILDNRIVLKQQQKEREEAEKAAKDPICTQDPHMKEHKFFFEHARKLMEDATNKNRSLYPFIKVIEQYKIDHRIDCVSKTPKHLISKLDIGLRKPGDSKAVAKHEASKMNEQTKTTSTTSQTYLEDKESMLKDCARVNELIAAFKAKGVVAKPKSNIAFGLECKHDGLPKQLKFPAGDIDCDILGKNIQADIDNLRKLNASCAASLH